MPRVRAWVNSAKHHLEALQVGAQKDQQLLGPVDVAVEDLLLVCSWRDTGMLVEVEEGSLETLLLQPGHHAASGGVVAARMG